MLRKGSRHPATIERDAAYKIFKQRIVEDSQRLLDAQYSIGLGQQYLFKIPKGKKEPVLITSEEEIRAYLRGDFEGSSDGYYYITTKDPNNFALDSMFNRAYGKAVDHYDITTKGEPITAINYLPPRDPDEQVNNNQTDI